MLIARHTIWISRPRDAVFGTFIDFSRAARWRQFVQSMELVGPGPLRVGSRVRTTLDLIGGRHTFDLEVLAFDPPSLWRHRTHETDFNGHVEYRFETEGEGTRVTFSMSATPIGVYGWLALPLMLMGRGRIYKEQLPQLKRLMEGP